MRRWRAEVVLEKSCSPRQESLKSRCPVSFNAITSNNTIHPCHLSSRHLHLRLHLHLHLPHSHLLTSIVTMEAVTTAVPPQLPARLLRFFTKYPPQIYGAKFTGQTIPLTKKDSKLLRIAQAEEQEQAKALAEARAEQKRQREAAAKRSSSSQLAISDETANWQRIKRINAGLVKAPKVRSPIPMPAIMSPRYISLPKLEKLRAQQIRTATAGQKRAAAVDTPDAELIPEVQTAVPMPGVMSPKYITLPELESLSPSSPTRRFPANPFLPKKTNNEWAGAAIGLRRQAELVKLAKKHGVEALLPASRKSTQFKHQRLLERGLRVKGTGEGQRVKGHKWERQYEAKMEARYEAMKNMPALIRDWEARGHGRGLKRDQYPKVKGP